MGRPAHGHVTAWGPPGSLDRARTGAGKRQQRRAAHRRATRAVRHGCWDPQRETYRRLRAEAALDMAAAQAGLAVDALLYML
jgi:hypothetical protein